ncbi:hypothetical protein BGW39_006337 [Mortierella sp. 14UC]|nr:hypothetical protein BGW39_006337 [Mortierella sp. 14UC]
MTHQESHLNVQAVRQVYENEQPSNKATPAGTIYLVCHSDASSCKDIILWDDILAAFKEDVVHVRYGAVILPFLKGPDFRNLDPLRIAKMPGATLDIVVRGQLGEKELSVESLQVALPTHQEINNVRQIPASNTMPTTARLNPVDDLVEATTENSPHNDNSASSSDDEEAKGPLPHVSAGINSNTITITKEPKISATNVSSKRGSRRRRSSEPVEDLVKVMKQASQGDKRAQNSLGDVYKNGRGVTQDYHVAMDWYVKSAEQGYLSAQNNIGNLYHHGLGVAQDNSKAMYWYLKAAMQGYATAQNNIGNLYYAGRGVGRDYSQALGWFLKAAEQGHATASNNIGGLYQHGQGVRQDYSAAKDWYLKAAKRGHASAQNNIGSLFQHGQGVAEDCSEAMEWYLKAARQGHLSAQYNIGGLYEHGDGVPSDKAKARTWYKKAADNGHDDSKRALERMRRM